MICFQGNLAEFDCFPFFLVNYQLTAGTMGVPRMTPAQLAAASVAAAAARMVQRAGNMPLVTGFQQSQNLNSSSSSGDRWIS